MQLKVSLLQLHEFCVLVHTQHELRPLILWINLSPYYYYLIDFLKFHFQAPQAGSWVVVLSSNTTNYEHNFVYEVWLYVYIGYRHHVFLRARIRCDHLIRCIA